MTTTTKKPTVKQLQAENATQLATITELRAIIEDREREVEGHRQSATQHSTELATLRERVGLARAALKPIKDKTDKWEQWPPPQVAVSGTLTWGDLKRAAETAVALQ